MRFICNSEPREVLKEMTLSWLLLQVRMLLGQAGSVLAQRRWWLPQREFSISFRQKRALTFQTAQWAYVGNVQKVNPEGTTLLFSPL